MLFFRKNPQKATNKSSDSKKGVDSFLAQRYMSKITAKKSKTESFSPESSDERASLYTLGSKKSKKKNLSKSGDKELYKASLTVEASLVVPIFFFALICIVYLMEIMAIQMNVRIGMHSALDTMVNQTSTISYMSTNSIEEILVEAIGEEKLDQSILVDGSLGLDCSESNISVTTGLVTLHVTYAVEVPISAFGFPGLSYEEEMIVKGWTGYESGVSLSTDEVYYITDNSSVYHVSASCTHLSLDISSADMGELEELRNEYGEIYSACSKCIEDAETLEGTIYIASSGAHYHSTLDCSGLTRSVYAVSSAEIIGMGVCSRCGY